MKIVVFFFFNDETMIIENMRARAYTHMRAYARTHTYGHKINNKID